VDGTSHVDNNANLEALTHEEILSCDANPLQQVQSTAEQQVVHSRDFVCSLSALLAISSVECTSVHTCSVFLELCDWPSARIL